MFKNPNPIPNLESAIDILSSEYMDKLRGIFSSFDSFRNLFHNKYQVHFLNYLYFVYTTVSFGCFV